MAAKGKAARIKARRSIAELEAELLKRTAERDEALAQQTATAQVLQVINSSPGDLVPVFDAILEKAVRLCGAAYGTLLRYNGQLFSMAAAVHPDRRLAERALSIEPFLPAPGGPLDRIVHGEAVTAAENIEESAGYRTRAEFRDMAESSGYRSLLNVALRKEGTLLGAITIFRKEAGTLPEKQIALLQNFSAQAVIAMENARLLTETREALEQQTATAQVLQVINSSPGDLVPVFEAMLEKAVRLCGGATGVFWTLEGERARLVGSHGVSPEIIEPLRRQGEAGAHPLLRRVIAGEHLFQFDLAEHEAYRSSLVNAAGNMVATGVRTVMFVALVKDGAAVGAFVISRHEVRPFSDREIALLQNFAAQAVVAMENARLITETREALEQQTATAEVLQVINSSPGDLVPVFDAILEKARAVCGFAHGSLNVYDGEYFRTVAMHGYPEAFAELLRQPRRTGPQARFLEGDRIVHITNVAAEGPASDDPVYRAAVEAGVRTVLFVPLRNDRNLLGYLTANRREVRPFSEKEVALLENFAAQAVIAMENARLLTETRAALEQQTATTEVLQVINSSPGDLTPVFGSILEKAVHLCEPAFGMMLAWDGERFHRVAWRGISAEQIEATRRPASPTPPPGAPGDRIARGESVVCIADLVEEVASGRIPPIQTLMHLGGRSYVMVALRKDEKLLGAMAIFRREVRPFTNKEIALLQNFAAQAVIAMENARLLTETREALEQQTATAEVLGVINSSPGDLAPVFDAMLEKAIRLCGGIQGALWTLDGERGKLAASHGNAPEFVAMLREHEHAVPGFPEAVRETMRGERLLHVPDLVEHQLYRVGDPVAKGAVELSGVRSLVGVPLVKDGASVGAFMIGRREARPFSDKQIALLQNFAAQAVIAMENARLLTETREALEQQTATAEVLQVINSSPGDLAPVFDAMLEKATRLCEAPFGILRTWDGERFHLGAVHGDHSRYRDWAQQRGPIPIRPDHRNASPLGRILAGERVVHFADTPGGEGYRTSSGFRDMVEASGVRSAIWVALRKDDALLGVIIVYRQEVRPFSDKQIALLQNFAAQAVIAMENARLLTETREALEQQTATAEVLQVINSSPGDLAPVFDAILERAHSLCGIDFGALQLQDGGKFRSVAARGLSEALAELLRQPFEPVPGSPPSRLMGGARIVHIADMAELARPGTADARAQAVSQDGFRTGLFVPLRKDADLLGYIVALRREVRLYSEKEIALLQNFAAQAVIAMENARLITETREALEQQTATAEVLGVINSSPGDLTPVFDAMLEKAMRLCDATYGHLYTYNGEQFSSAAVRGEPRFVEWLRRIGPVRPLSQDSPLGRLSGGERIVRIVDAREERGYGTAPGFREMVDNSGIRSGITVGLDKDGALHGAITIYRHEVRPFSEKQIALLQNFAAQAVIAMENARLIGELRQRTDEVAELNRGLETRVAEQVEELGRVGRLKRFLAPQLAELIVSHGDEKILESHRREIVVVFCDLRGYTAFTETAEPEEVLDLLREYHGALGPLVSQFEGTLDQFSGDGIMVFFNDPVPCPDPAERAVKMAMAMRETAGTLIASWRRRGRLLGFGAGIAQGYATLGQIGFAERSGYTAIGTVCNLAARLCAEAQDAQILIGQRVAVAVEETITLEEVGALTLKGLTQPVVAYNVPLAPIQPALRVIEGGPQSV